MVIEVTPEHKAADILDRIGLTGEATLYAQLVSSIATAIREERETVLSVNRKMRADWHDSPDAIAYGDELAIRLMSEWGERLAPPL